MMTEKVRLHNLETGERMEVTKDSAESLLEQDKFVVDEGKEKTSDEAGEVEKLNEDTSKGEEEDDLVIEVKAGGFEEGEHKGTIIDYNKKEVEVGKEDLATYLDLIIDDPSEEGRGKVGYNYYVTPQSELGKLLKRFGVNIGVGSNVDVKDAIIGNKIKFYVQENEDGYTEIKKDTVKPAEK